MMKLFIPILLTLSFGVSAWLPFHKSPSWAHASDTTLSASTNNHGLSKRFNHTASKIRGVNLGSLFVVEPWMAANEWKAMGCNDTKSEFDCVRVLGQDAADEAFQRHWSSWITENDMDQIKEFGLNTIRVPVGYWMVEDTVDRSSEYFPRGGISHLDRIADWAASRELYVILDLHGAPGAQVANEPFTGQLAPTAAFFQTPNYNRTYTFLSNITTHIHTHDAYRTTGMLEVVNEPERNHASLISEYYTTAYTTIRTTESQLNVPTARHLTVQFMGAGWGAGDPADALRSVQEPHTVAVDNHRYLKWDTDIQEHTPEVYIATSCNDTFPADAPSGNLTIPVPLVVGEWSLAPKDEVAFNEEWDPARVENKEVYRRWWAAQVMAYERAGMGWVFWSWKTELENDWRWGYREAVEWGAVPRDAGEGAEMGRDVCGGGDGSWYY